jgi:hypothetical protein
MQVRIADGGRRRCWSAGITQPLAVEHVLVHVVLDEEPRALVLRLVLATTRLRWRWGSASSRRRMLCAETGTAARCEQWPRPKPCVRRAA